jgi:biotin transporter BioY
VKKIAYYREMILPTLGFLAFLILLSFLLGPFYEGLRNGDFHRHFKVWIDKDLSEGSLFMHVVSALILSWMTVQSNKQNIEDKK